MTSCAHAFSEDVDPECGTKVSSEAILNSTRPPILNWQVSRFDVSGISPQCVVICARGHPSREDAIELEKIPLLGAFWATALSARLFHRVEADFSPSCTLDLRLRDVCADNRVSNRVVSLARPVRRQYACNHFHPLPIYWHLGE